jgi:hypothetical protein
MSLCICAAAAAALGAVTHVPWFGSFTGDTPEPEYSAVSGLLVPPHSPGGLAPATQNWGYLLVSWSAVLAASALATAIALPVIRHRHPRGVSALLVAVGIGSLVLVALVLPELLSRVPFDEASFVGADWGAFTGLGLAVLSSIGAWFAWATWKYPQRWGLETSGT